MDGPGQGMVLFLNEFFAQAVYEREGNGSITTTTPPWMDGAMQQRPLRRALACVVR